MRRPLPEVTDDYEFSAAKIIGQEKIEEALEILQRCEPAGIGARSLQECLLLQLKRKKKTSSKFHFWAIEILEKHYQPFVQRQFIKIKSLLGITNEELEKCIQYISKYIGWTTVPLYHWQLVNLFEKGGLNRLYKYEKEIVRTS